MSLEEQEKEKIYSVLDRIKDPEIGVSIVKLKMVEYIDKTGSALSIKIKLTVPGCPLSATIEKDIKQAMAELGYEDTKILFGFMTKQELEMVKKEIFKKDQKLPSPIEKYDKKAIKNVIAVYSAKGGVGKSTVVSMLALISAAMGYKTGILDCDISGPSITALFNLKKMASATKENRIIPAEYHGIELLGIDMLTSAETLIWRGPLVSSAIRQMYDDTEWGNLDVLFLDLPPGTSDGPLTVFQAIPVDMMVLVTTPQMLSQTIGRKTLAMADILKIPITGIIENMSYFICDKCGNKHSLPDGEKIKELPIIARLPFISSFSVVDGLVIDKETKESLMNALVLMIKR